MLRVPAEIGYRELVTRTVASVCKIACPTQDDTSRVRDELVSAVGEAFNNAVFHAYAETQGEVTLLIDFDTTRLTIELLDDGRSFDIDGVPDPNLSEPQESGMGLFIIRNFVDEVTYQPGPPNQLRLVKRISCR